MPDLCQFLWKKQFWKFSIRKRLQLQLHNGRAAICHILYVEFTLWTPTVSNCYTVKPERNFSEKELLELGYRSFNFMFRNVFSLGILNLYVEVLTFNCFRVMIYQQYAQLPKQLPSYEKESSDCFKCQQTTV